MIIIIRSSAAFSDEIIDNKVLYSCYMILLIFFKVEYNYI